MIGFKVEAAKQQFFDRKKVIDAVGKAKAKVLSKGGAFIRRTAQQSMRAAPKGTLARIRSLFKLLAVTKDPAERSRIDQDIHTLQRRASAPEGKPPRSVLGLLKQFLFFVWDPTSRSCVIGPAKLNQKGDDVPEALEKGGTVRVISGPRSNRRVVRTVKIAPHPYMGPALEKEAPNLAGQWADSVKA